MSFILLGILNSQAAGAGAAGAYDLLETQVLSSSASSVTFTGLNSAYASTYKHLQFRMTLRDASSYGGGVFTVNGAGYPDYARHHLEVSGSSVRSEGYNIQPNITLNKAVTGNNTGSNEFGASILDILDPFSTSKNTTFRMLNGRPTSDGISLASGLLDKTEAMDSITFSSSWVAGCRFSLYGIK